MQAHQGKSPMVNFKVNGMERSFDGDPDMPLLGEPGVPPVYRGLRQCHLRCDRQAVRELPVSPQKLV
jgi:hypothetical protein